MASATVLVVEHDILVRQPLAQYLRDCGYRALEATTPAEAHEALARPDARIDVVLVGVHGVPSETGFVLASWIRQNQPHVKVLIGGTIAKVLQLAGDLCDEEGPAPVDHRAVLDHIRRMLAARDRGQ
jgi:DNA-binding NtrC family response regulator